MQQKTTNFFKGMGLGLAVGATATVVSKMALKNNKKVTKTTNKAVKAVSSFVDGVQTLMK